MVLLFLFEPLAPPLGKLPVVFFPFFLSFFTLADPVLEEEGGVEGSYASLPPSEVVCGSEISAVGQIRPD